MGNVQEERSRKKGIFFLTHRETDNLTTKRTNECVHVLFLKHGKVHLISTGSTNGAAFKENIILKPKKSSVLTERLSGLSIT